MNVDMKRAHARIREIQIGFRNGNTFQNNEKFKGFNPIIFFFSFKREAGDSFVWD